MHHVGNFVWSVLLFCMFLFYFMCSIFLYCFFVLYLLLYIAVSFLFLYKSADHCHWMETQLQSINIISYNSCTWLYIYSKFSFDPLNFPFVLLTFNLYWSWKLHFLSANGFLFNLQFIFCFVSSPIYLGTDLSIFTFL